MKWFGIVFVVVLLLTACGPAETVIQTASSETQRVLPTATLAVIAQPPPSTATPLPSPTLTETIIPTPTSSPIEITDAKGVKLALVPAGEFTMGSDNGNPNEQPARQVYLDTFYMDIYEVTNARYKACVDAGGCRPPQKTRSYNRLNYYGNSEFNDYPVVYVDWSQANNYCKWRGGGLPTEAQWEKAARGTDGRAYPWGGESACLRANSFGCGSFETKVGIYAGGKSSYGIYDMAGNVQEWVADWYRVDYYANLPASNPLGPDAGQYRVLRGGSFFGDVHATYRNFFAPNYSQSDIGFRCAEDATP